MKVKAFFLLCLCCLVPTLLSAQDKQDKDLHFIYISHDRQTNVQKLTHELQQTYDDLKEYGNEGIFYLANGEEPIIVRVNTDDENEKDFPHLIGELQEKLAHEVASEYDVNRIMELFEQYPFETDDHTLLYKSVNWNYYVTSFFWSMLYNESVIATLYWTMGMDQLRVNQEFYLNILRSTDDNIDYEGGNAMGVKNYSEINNSFAIVTY